MRRRPDAAEFSDPPRPCALDGCDGAGEYRAPKSPREMEQTLWLCREHIRLHNAQWDFFAGMGAEEIERFRAEALTGHRPTWRLGTQPFHQRRFKGDVPGLDFGDKHPPPAEAAPPEQRRALAVLDMTWPVTALELKRRYRLLVKTHHPDVNPGDSQAEERFKTIVQAYESVRRWLKS